MNEYAAAIEEQASTELVDYLNNKKVCLNDGSDLELQEDDHGHELLVCTRQCGYFEQT